MLSRTVKLALVAAMMSSLSACWALCGPPGGGHGGGGHGGGGPGYYGEPR